MISIPRTLLAAAFALTAAGLHAQSDPNGMPLNNPNTQSTPGVQHPMGADSSQNSSSGADAQTMKDRMFLRKAAQGGAMQVQFALLALQKSSNDAVKRFAQHMVDDHTTIAQSLKPYAEELGVLTPKPARADQQEYDRLSVLSGASFDHEYLADMVKDHHKDLQEFTLEADSASDPELKEAVAKAQIIIARHTRVVDRLAAATVAGNK